MIDIDTRINPSIDSLTQELLRTLDVKYIEELISRGADIHYSCGDISVLRHFLFLTEDNFKFIFHKYEFFEDDIKYCVCDNELAELIKRSSLIRSEIQNNLKYMENYFKLKKM